MAIQIYFAGLICHYSGDPHKTCDPGKKRFSILVKDPEHTPYISINHSDPEVVTTDVVFDPSGNARTRDVAFTRSVPHLADLTAVDALLKDAGNLKVVLPFGDFCVAEYFPKGAIFEHEGDITGRACIARITLLIADKELTVTVNRQYQHLVDGDWVFIENASNKPIDKDGDHWSKFSKILDGSQKLAKYKTGYQKHDCASVTPGDHLEEVHKLMQDVKNEYISNEHVVIAAASSECTNSQWP